MREKRIPLKNRYVSTKERFLERRKQGIGIEPTANWWRQRHLFFTLISLALVLVAAFTVRGLHRLFAQPNKSAQSYQSEPTEIENIDYETAKRMFSGEIPAPTAPPQ